MKEIVILGTGVSKGIRIGRAYFYPKNNAKTDNKYITDDLIASELERLHKLIKQADKELVEIIKQTEEIFDLESSKIIEIQLELLNDPVLISELEIKIKNSNYSVEKAVIEVFNNYKEQFVKINDNYFSERAHDIKDLGDRLIKIATDNVDDSTVEEKPNNHDKILIIDEITPSQVVQLHKDNITGFISRTGGKNSHSTILARSLNIPAVVGIGDEINLVNPDDLLIIDGNNGEIYLNPSKEIMGKYHNLIEQERKASEELKHFANRKSTTKDGYDLSIAANISSSHEAKLAIENGFDGIGLFRTEFIFIDNNHLPDEEEQYQIYKDIALTMGNKPIIIRTLDIGGDKQIPYLPIEGEMNPFLGYRAIRLTLDQKKLFITQLRAILRASVHGKFKIMFPMIAILQEIRESKKLLSEAMNQLREEHIPYDETIEIGMMVEVPSVAFMIDKFVEEVDFFSIGTNDLTQYTLAVDRTNDKVSYLYDCFNPAVIHLIKRIIDSAHLANKWVSMCGGMASNPLAMPLLIGLELDEFSIDIGALNEIKKTASALSYSSAKKITERILECNTNEEVRKTLEDIKLR